MSKVIVTETYLENIGDAIRSKLGGSDTYKPSEMAGAISQIHGDPVLEALSVTENGTYDPSSGKDGFSQAVVNVPNSYAAGDEGKVVDNGALVAQTSLSITDNGTYDTTLKNEVVVNVSGGGGGGTLTGTTPPSSSQGSNGDYYVQTARTGELASDGNCYINTNIVQNAKFKIETEVELTQATSNYDTFFGCRNGSAGRFTGRFTNNTAGDFAIQKSADATASYTSYQYLKKTNFLNVYRKITLSDYVAFDDVIKQLFPTDYTNPFPYPIFLFANNNAGTAGDYAYASMKYFKMWDNNGGMVRYLVPASNNGEACMYDLVTGQYFTNGGTGTFTYTDGGIVYDALIWKKISGNWEIVSEVMHE